MTSQAAKAKTTRRLVFQPAPGHPGGKYSRPASVPAEMPVSVAPNLGPGTWMLTASIDGCDDYQRAATSEDFTFEPLPGS